MPRTRSVRTTAFLTVVLTLSPSLLLAQPDGHVGVRLMEAPADRANDPRAQMYIVDHVAPGALFSRRIEVVNTTPSELRVDLYPAAVNVDETGWQPAPGREENELTGWIDVEPSQVTVPANGSRTATVTIHVPSDAADGERYAVIWAQPPVGGADVRVVNRVGVRVYLSVGSGREPPSDFNIANLTARRNGSGVPIVSAEIRNTGLRALDLTGDLTLTDGPAGLSAGPFATDGPTTLAPGDTAEMSVELDAELPNGPWLARMVGRSGTLKKAVEATITFPEASGESADPVAAEEVPLHQDRGFLVPLAIGLTLLTLLSLFLAWWFLFYRRRRDDEEDEQAGRPMKQKAGVGG